MALTVGDLKEGTRFTFHPDEHIASGLPVEIIRGRQTAPDNVEIINPLTNERVWGCFPYRRVVEEVVEEEVIATVSKSVYVYKTLYSESMAQLDSAVSTYVTEMGVLEHDLISVTPFSSGIHNYEVAIMMVRYETV